MIIDHLKKITLNMRFQRLFYEYGTNELGFKPYLCAGKMLITLISQGR